MFDFYLFKRIKFYYYKIQVNFIIIIKTNLNKWKKKLKKI